MSCLHTSWIASVIDGSTSLLPTAYESTGDETWFTCHMDPEPTARRVFWFHRPETLEWQIEDHVNHRGGTLRARIPDMPILEHDPARLRDAQFEAITNLERSLKDNHSRALIQMATGSGKTFAAANICERLIRHAQAKRILFLVDRGNLGKQTLKEFQGFEVPGSGRKFTELYNVQHLTHNKVDPVASVCIGTIQRVYSMLRGEAELPEDLDEESGYELAPDRPVEVDYQPALPIEAFDVIIVDECHRSIYGVWRQVLEYFDAFLIGLTATPGKQTFGFFNKNLVMEYGFPQAVADGVNVDFDVFRLSTAISEGGSTIEAGYWTTFRDRETRDERLEQVDEDLTYDEKALDKKVVAKDQIRTVIRAIRDNLPAMFPDREVDEHGRLRHIPKTLIFAKDDSHAEDIVRIAREELGKGNDVIAKITYKASDGAKPEQLLQDFRTSYYPRIAVTVDMIATGTDVKPIEMVVFMRMVRSRNFFEQMKGRGVRTIPDSDLQVVTPDATHKDRFVLVDAVGVTETKLIETTPLERKRGVSLEKLLHQVALGQVSEDLVSTLASRLARIDSRIAPADRDKLEAVAGQSLKSIEHGLVEAIDPDRQLAAAQIATGTIRAQRRRAGQGQGGTCSPRRCSRSPPTPSCASAGERAAQLRPGDRRDQHRPRHPGRVRRRRPRPRRRDRRVVPGVPRRAQGRDHRPPGALQPPLRQAPHLPRHQGAGRSHRPATAPLDPRAPVGGVRDPRRLQGPRLGRHRAHQHRLARPVHPRRGRRAGAVPRTGRRTVRRLAPPTGERRPQLHRRAARLARPHPRPPGSLAVDRTAGAARPAVQPARRPRPRPRALRPGPRRPARRAHRGRRSMKRPAAGWEWATIGEVAAAGGSKVDPRERSQELRVRPTSDIGGADRRRSGRHSGDPATLAESGSCLLVPDRWVRAGDTVCSPPFAPTCARRR